MSSVKMKNEIFLRTIININDHNMPSLRRNLITHYTYACTFNYFHYDTFTL